MNYTVICVVVLLCGLVVYLVERIGLSRKIENKLLSVMQANENEMRAIREDAYRVTAKDWDDLKSRLGKLELGSIRRG